MEPLDREYCYRRAEEELERARTSTTARVVQVHYELAELYLDRLYGAEGNPRLRPEPWRSSREP
jgi:hypothetical protein